MSKPQQTEDMTAVRSALFAALRGLSDKDNPMEIDRATAICGTAQTIINSVKVEVDYMKVSGGGGSGFIPDRDHQAGVIEQRPGVTVRRNVLR